MTNGGSRMVGGWGAASDASRSRPTMVTLVTPRQAAHSHHPLAFKTIPNDSW
jgi:hypothetical protein